MILGRCVKCGVLLSVKMDESQLIDRVWCAMCDVDYPLPSRTDLEMFIGRNSNDSMVILNGRDISGSVLKVELDVQPGKLPVATLSMRVGSVVMDGFETDSDQLNIDERPSAFLVRRS